MLQPACSQPCHSEHASSCVRSEYLDPAGHGQVVQEGVVQVTALPQGGLCSQAAHAAHEGEHAAGQSSPGTLLQGVELAAEQLQQARGMLGWQPGHQLCDTWRMDRVSCLFLGRHPL